MYGYSRPKVLQMSIQAFGSGSWAFAKVAHGTCMDHCNWIAMLRIAKELHIALLFRKKNKEK